MAKRSNEDKPKNLGELDDILRQGDQLPVLDHRNPDDIAGLDDDGIPNKATRLEQDLRSQRQVIATESFDFADWKKKVLKDSASRAIVEDFLKYRHREWEQ